MCATRPHFIAAIYPLAATCLCAKRHARGMLLVVVVEKAAPMTTTKTKWMRTPHVKRSAIESCIVIPAPSFLVGRG